MRRDSATVEIIDAKFVVVADALGEGAFELRAEGWRHGESQISDFRSKISD
jgi:hypothetical protein